MPKMKRAGLGVFLSATILFAIVACTESDGPPWTDREMQEKLDYIGEVGETYALLDMCIPMIEADAEARYQLVSAIEADRYAKLLQIDTNYELKKLFRFFRERGGTSEQHLALRLHYEEASRVAEAQITSVQVCVDTITDYANTIISMRVQ